MKRLPVCILLLSLASACSSTVDRGQWTKVNYSPTENSPTSIATFPLPTETPTLTPTSTLLPCDPLTESCIEDGHFFLDRPIALPGTVTIDPGYPYGNTADGTREPHHGVEFYNASGTPVLAAADGTVVIAGNDETTVYGPQTGFYGNLIVLEHHFPGIDQPIFTLYGHLSKINVQTGQAVRSGEKIGEVGATGIAIGSHLHFEVRLGQDNYASTRNPILWLKPLTGEDGNSFGVIAGRLVDAQGKLIYTADLNLQYFRDPDGPQTAVHSLETYASEGQPVHSDDTWDENFAPGDLPSGRYRLSLMWGGRLYDQWLDVQPGKVTFIVFQIGQ